MKPVNYSEQQWEAIERLIEKMGSELAKSNGVLANWHESIFKKDAQRAQACQEAFSETLNRIYRAFTELTAKNPAFISADQNLDTKA